MQEKIYFINSHGQKLAGIIHIPEGNGPFPAVIRAHGYGSSKDGRTSVALAERFKEFVFLRFDFHGHGESEGRFEDVDALQCVDDLISAIKYVSGLPNVDKNRIAITGSSLGGLATTLAAAWSDEPWVACAAMVCPVSDFVPLRAASIKYRNIAAYDVYKEAEKISCPALIVHGDNDTVVPLEQSIELAKHLRRGRLHIIHKADHQFSEERQFDEMIERSATFIKQSLASPRDE